MIAIFSAMEIEIAEFRKRTRAMRVYPSTGPKVWRGKSGQQEFLLILTGIGMERARRNVDWALKEYPIHLIISTGCGGALDEKTKAGDILVCDQMKCGETNEPGIPTDKGIESDPDLVKAAMQCGHNHHYSVVKGHGVSINQVCLTPQSKSDLGRQFDCGEVDMESYWIAQKAAEKNIPFIAVRSISDEVGDDLTLLVQISAGNKIRPQRLVRAILRRPKNLKTLISCYRDFRLAGKNLAIVLSELVGKI